MPDRGNLTPIRRRYAAAIMRATGAADARVEAAFAATAREDFLTPPPWRIFSPGGVIESVTSDPAELYDDVLVVLDPTQGINNGQPSLHAAWLSTVDPRSGETAIHIGIGAGYYTAILARLVAPGRVVAYEIDERLADLARRRLAAFPGVDVRSASGAGRALPEADVVYVNAGATAPDAAWLRALRPNGRLIFPWQPRAGGGLTLLVTRGEAGFSAAATMAVGFVACAGAQEKPAAMGDPWATRSVWLTAERAPDATATAVFEAVWFSSDAVATLGRPA